MGSDLGKLMPDFALSLNVRNDGARKGGHGFFNVIRIIIKCYRLFNSCVNYLIQQYTGQQCIYI